MKSVLSQMLTDSKLMVKNIFLWVTLALLIIIIFVVHFLLPKQVESPIIQIVTYATEYTGDIQASSLQELEETVKEQSNTVGIANTGDTYKIYAKNLTEQQATAVFNKLLSGNIQSDVVTVNHNYSITEQAPFNKRLVPLFICFEAVIIGLLLIGALILTEKSEKLLRSYRVSPSGAFSYLLSKTVLFTLVGTAYAMVMAFCTVGFQYNMVAFVLLSLLASFLFSLLGIVVAAHFQSLSNWFMLLALVMGTIMLTMFAYIFPAISIPFMKWLPSYPIIFSYEQIIFADGDILTSSFTVLSVWIVVLFVAAYLSVRLRLLRPHKGE